LLVYWKFEKNQEMCKKFFLGAGWSLLVLLLSVTGARGWSATPLAAQDEAALFSMADLGPVDLSPKRVVVEIYASPHPELNAFHRLLEQAWPSVQAFYATNMRVILEMVPGQATPGRLVAAKHLRLEALTHDEWLDRSFKAFEVEPPYRLRFAKVCRDKYAFAHLPLSTIHLDFKHFEKDICGNAPGDAKNNPKKLANVMIHELGHLFGLYHANEFVNDPIPEVLPGSKIPDLMSQQLAQPRGLGCVDFQKRLVHSYLSGGKVFQQYRYVNFDPLRYLEMVKLYNHYQEPKSH
jgi:hypothetical protein